MCSSIDEAGFGFGCDCEGVNKALVTQGAGGPQGKRWGLASLGSLMASLKGKCWQCLSIQLPSKKQTWQADLSNEVDWAQPCCKWVRAPQAVGLKR